MENTASTPPQRYECGKFVYMKFINEWRKYFIEKANWEFPRKMGDPMYWDYTLVYFGDNGGYPCGHNRYSEGYMASMIEDGTLALSESDLRHLVRKELDKIEAQRELLVQKAIDAVHAQVKEALLTLVEGVEKEVAKECLFH